MNERPHLPFASALTALARCGVRTAALLLQRRIHQPTEYVGRRLGFADGTTTEVYRETVIDRPSAGAPTVLLVEFRLRFVRWEWTHALFRLESMLNTVLFAGFPGFVTKLWCRHDERGVYRGLYEWDDAALAEAYVGALWWALALVSVRRSIHYAALPGLQRDEVLHDPRLIYHVAPDETGAWWRLTSPAAATAVPPGRRHPRRFIRSERALRRSLDESSAGALGASGGGSMSASGTGRRTYASQPCRTSPMPPEDRGRPEVAGAPFAR